METGKREGNHLVMNAAGFIAGRLRFNGRVAVAATAISFFIIIVAVSISDGFSREIRSGVAAITGDILITDRAGNLFGDSGPVSSEPSFLPELEKIAGVRGISPVVYRTGIVRKGDKMHGVLFKGTASDTASMRARVPATLAENLGIEAGDGMQVWFVGEKIKPRRFEVGEIYDNLIDSEDGLVIYVPISDMRRLNGWSQDEASALELTLDPKLRSRKSLRTMTERVGATVALSPDAEENGLGAVSAAESYPRLFDWLDLIDYNVIAILLLMTLVAGFNMISGLLILLFRNISTIGTLKSLGMTDRAVAGVFLRVGARITAVGMLAGNAAALLFCAIQGCTHILKLDPANYFLSFVPVSVDIPRILLADAAAFCAILLLLLIPSLFISRVDPAETVRAA